MTYCCIFNWVEDLVLLVFVVIPFLWLLMPDLDNRKSDSRYQPIKDKSIPEQIDLSKMGANEKQSYTEVKHD